MNRRRVKASKNLLRYLPYIADALQRAAATEANKGRSTIHVALDVSTIKLKHIHELGAVLERIAFGDDASKAFRQDERTKPRKTDLHKVAALAYWSVRALNPKARDDAALREARKILGEPIEDSTIRKHIAQAHRETSLNHLSRLPFDLRIESGSNTLSIEHRSAEQVAALREYLRKKSPRKNVDE